ncbi:hypothetical protein GCM10027180_28960 [Microbulbifer echini]
MERGNENQTVCHANTFERDRLKESYASQGEKLLRRRNPHPRKKAVIENAKSVNERLGVAPAD